MKASRELDALVAEKVMEWEWHWLPSGYWLHDRPKGISGAYRKSHESPVEVMNVPKYSVGIAAAWQVIEKWDEQGWDWEITTGKNNIHVWVLTDNERVFAHRGIAPEAPLAICLAALKACGVELEAGEEEG